MAHDFDRIFQISDGLASIARKRVLSLINEMEREKVITKAERRKLVSGLSKVKKNVYDTLNRELKRAISVSQAIHAGIRSRTKTRKARGRSK